MQPRRASESEREPTDEDMAFVTPAEVMFRWEEIVYTVIGIS